MRQACHAPFRMAWIGILAFWIPLAGPAITPHVLEHEWEQERARQATPPHDHHGVHFETVHGPEGSPDCVLCLRSNGTGNLRAASPQVTLDATPTSRGPGLHGAPSFRLAGRVTPRAPPTDLRRI